MQWYYKLHILFGQLKTIKWTTGLLFQDKANGQHLGIWSPGFPELQVPQKSPHNGSKIQCSLLFMEEALKKILDDQQNNLNPKDTSLHENLNNSINSVNMLAGCVKEILGGQCLSAPSPPKMPKHVFERKQWSHTLLKEAKHYLTWLEHNTGHQITGLEGKRNIN